MTVDAALGESTSVLVNYEMTDEFLWARSDGILILTQLRAAELRSALPGLRPGPKYTHRPTQAGGPTSVQPGVAYSISRRTFLESFSIFFKFSFRSLTSMPC